MTKRRVLWIGLGVLVALLVVARLFTPPPPPSLGMRFWVRTDDPAKRVYADRAGAELEAWTWNTGQLPPAAGLDLLTARWRPSSTRGWGRRLGLIPMTEGHVIASLLPAASPEDPWRECLSINRAWPGDTEIDPTFAGEWEVTGGVGNETTRVVFQADGTVIWAKDPGQKWRWGRIDGVVVLGYWHGAEARWSMAGSLVPSADGESYRSATGETGRRIR
jgi:hypothetical protein